MREGKSTGRVAGKVAFVTGAGSGIGKATAELLAREGACVAVADIDETSSTGVARKIESAGGIAIPVALDVSSEVSWEEAIRQTLGRWSRLDVLVNCAGISFAKPVTEMTLEEWRHVHAVNLDGVFLGTRAGIRAMRSEGGGGSIINISSLSGLEVFPGATAYSASKAAVIHFSKVAARECEQAGNGVRINVLAPGGVRTPMWKAMPFWQELAKEGEAAAWRQLDPQNSFYSAEEIAAAVLDLACDESARVNGSVLIMNRNGAR